MGQQAAGASSSSSSVASSVVRWRRPSSFYLLVCVLAVTVSLGHMLYHVSWLSSSSSYPLGALRGGISRSPWNSFSYLVRFLAFSSSESTDTPILRDDSDDQWRDFRRAIPTASLAMGAYVMLSRTMRIVFPAQGIGHACTAAVFGVAFVAYLHGYACLFLLAFAILGFSIVQTLVKLVGDPAAMNPKKVDTTSHVAPSKTATRQQAAAVAVVWAYSLAVMYIARDQHGIAFSNIPLIPHDVAMHMDRHRGSLRWHVSFNLVVLKYLAYACDAIWASTPPPPTAASTNAAPPLAVLSDDKRYRRLTEMRRSRGDYASPVLYVAFILYPPLYIAGPTSSFNAFAAYVRQSAASDVPPAASTKKLLEHLARLVVAFMTTELFTHISFANAIATRGGGMIVKPHHSGDDYELRKGTGTPFDYASIGFYTLMFMWLKFLTIWRFFRWFALADGVAPPENMKRCMCDNYDVEGFWKGWHSSFNLWLVRYVYIPLGGGGNLPWSIWAVFLFVAAWHDVDPRLLVWACIFGVYLIPERVLKWACRVAPRKRAEGSTHVFWRRLAAFVDGPWYRPTCALVAALNIWVLLVGNLVGYALGWDGLVRMVRESLSGSSRNENGLVEFFVCSILVLSAAAELMFEKRAHEAIKEARVTMM
ncbi:glycerol transporter [Pycnococcus provasolii]|uniref:Glycerol transporter n=2 Tax=Pycnococcus provasolii TaxID=41880 RepID=A0A830HV80_9CHLO|nr:glycerol transporter [Pycnococcus provasolii]